MDLEKQKYPIGHYQVPAQFTAQTIQEYIATIAAFPEKLSSAVQNMTDDQLETPYRPGGWTIRQVVHHCADSHLNALIRHKLSLTEDNPTIKPYHEALWANLADYGMPVTPSLQLIAGLHARWSALLKSLTPSELQRTFIHPEHSKTFTLQESIGLYAWHCEHHLAHILQVKTEK